MVLDKLLQQDPTLYPMHETYGSPKTPAKQTGFWSLLSIVNSQLISTSVARTILGRIECIMPNHTVESWLQADVETLRGCGLSMSKIQTLTTIAKDIKAGILDLESLAKLDTKTIHQTLIAYKGIGNWSANAFALSHNQDVFLYDDLGVRDGMKIALGLSERPSIQFCKTHYETHWSPYGTIATYFMWHIKNNHTGE